MPNPSFTRGRDRAFSLIESLVVLATVGILVFVLIPAFDVYILGHSPIGADATIPAEVERLRSHGTYDIRFAPEEARKAAEQPSEKMPEMPTMPTMPTTPE